MINAMPSSSPTTFPCGQKPNDPDLPKQWGLEKINIADAWCRMTNFGKSPIVAIIDTGVDITHPDLKGSIWRNPNEIPDDQIDNDQNGYVDDVHGWNFFAKNNKPIDQSGHGTHIAGIIAAQGNNGIGIAGINWHAQIMPLRIFDDSPFASEENQLAAIRYAIANGAKIINLSWSTNENPELYKLIAGSDALFIVAASNKRLNIDRYPVSPASYQLPNLITVTATDVQDKRLSYASVGKKSVHLGAPGVNIYSTLPQNSNNTGRELNAKADKPVDAPMPLYGEEEGTSMATPFVTGVASLIWAEHPEWTPAQVRDRVLQSIEKVDSLQGQSATGGRLNARKGLS